MRTSTGENVLPGFSGFGGEAVVRYLVLPVLAVTLSVLVLTIPGGSSATRNADDVGPARVIGGLVEGLTGQNTRGDGVPDGFPATGQSVYALEVEEDASKVSDLGSPHETLVHRLPAAYPVHGALLDGPWFKYETVSPQLLQRPPPPR